MLSPNDSHRNKKNGLDLSQGLVDRWVPVTDIYIFLVSVIVIGMRHFLPYNIVLFFGIPMAPDNLGVTVHAPEYRNSFGVPISHHRNYT